MSDLVYSPQEEKLVADDSYVRQWPHPLRLMAVEVPEEVADDFIQAQRAMDARVYTAAALLARRALEGITVALGETKGSLAARLRALSARGEIEGRMLEWANSLREVGNDAAHQPGQRVSQEDARDLLQFVEALADYVFTYRTEVAQLTVELHTCGPRW